MGRLGLARPPPMALGGGRSTPKAKSKNFKNLIWPLGWLDHPQGPPFGLGVAVRPPLGAGWGWLRSHPHGPWGWTRVPLGVASASPMGWLGVVEAIPWPLGVDRPPPRDKSFFFFLIWPLGVAEATPMARPLLFIFVFLIFYYFVFNLFLKINIIKYYYF
jgi:hypothetical protein